MRKFIVSAVVMAGAVHCMGVGCGDVPSTSCFDGKSAGSVLVLRTGGSAFNGNDSNFDGDYAGGTSGGIVNVFSRETVGGVERKIVVIVPTLSGTYDLKDVYLSYTETEGSAKKVWKAGSGSLVIENCGDAVILSIDAEMAVLTASNNSAAGGFRMLGYLRGPA